MCHGVQQLLHAKHLLEFQKTDADTNLLLLSCSLWWILTGFPPEEPKSFTVSFSHHPLSFVCKRRFAAHHILLDLDPDLVSSPLGTFNALLQ